MFLGEGALSVEIDVDRRGVIPVYKPLHVARLAAVRGTAAAAYVCALLVWLDKRQQAMAGSVVEAAAEKQAVGWRSQRRLRVQVDCLRSPQPI